MPDTETGSYRNSVRDFRFGSEVSRHALVGTSDSMPPNLDLGAEATVPAADQNLEKEIE